ncbi:MAG: helix-turn-helix domain-containing protein [Chloroflexota bacterium]|nr:helix-turn-helix domain-containing protein [Chloroflexota bacterium]
MDTFAKRLVELRRQRMFTQEGLGRAADISTATITKLETVATAKPHVKTVKRLAAALEVDAAWLMWGEEAPALIGTRRLDA